MTSIFRRTLFLAVIVFTFSFFGSKAQNDLTELLQAGPEDASKLMGAYLDPVVVGLSYSLNGGWFHTAKAHKSFGFDLAISANAVFIPSSRNTFRPSDLAFKSNTTLISSPLGDEVPTISGADVQTEYESELTLPDGTKQIVNFNGPPGLEFKENFKVSGVAAPMVQLGIGIYKNTDLKIRFVPEQTFDNSSVKMLGFGVMHDIKQHIPGIKLMPFDLSALVGFTKISGRVDMEFDKPANDTSPQEMKYDVNAWLFQALISKKFSVITFYGGLGYNAVKSSSDVVGSYLIYGANTPDTSDDVVVKDPVRLAFNNNSLRVTAGVRLKLGPIFLNGDYTLQKYNMLSVGLGVAVR